MVKLRRMRLKNVEILVSLLPEERNKKKGGKARQSIIKNGEVVKKIKEESSKKVKL